MIRSGQPAKKVPRLLALLLAAATVGCAAGPEWVSVRSRPNNPLASRLNLRGSQGPKETPRTAQLLRRYDLGTTLKHDRKSVIKTLRDAASPQTQQEHLYAMAEIAYLGAQRVEKSDPEQATELYGAAILQTYRYLFNEKSGVPCNPYDPQFRGACDLYNQSLEGMLRIIVSGGGLRPNERRTIQTASHVCSFEVKLHSTGWRSEDVSRFEFVSDYRVNGLRNHYHTYGLGVPLIAIRKPYAHQDAAEQYYPSQLCFPLTAFLRVDESSLASQPASGRSGPAAAPKSPRFVLELHDPLDRQQLVVRGRQVPLESDLSTPLAYFLNQPALREQEISTLGLLRPDSVKQLQGLYMLEPYDPDKMPVLMVHGLWSSPITWMEMYNDLRSDPVIRSRYQFWSYLYPTGQPFWASAAQLRRDLGEMRQAIDPQLRTPALDQMVLVGHSMGGLVSKMQSVDSGEDFWRINSDRSFAELKADEDLRREIGEAYFFRPNPSVRRVVTIGTPHRGSSFANDFTRWLGRKFIDAPMRLMQGRQALYADNADYFRTGSAVEVNNSIESLSPNSPLLPALLAAKPGPWVRYHNIVGRKPDTGLHKLFGEEGDGVVELASARLDGMPQLASQIVVPSDHVSVHRHPQSVLEVRRVLLEQLAEIEDLPYGLGSGVQLAGPDRFDSPTAEPTKPQPVTPNAYPVTQSSSASRISTVLRNIHQNRLGEQAIQATHSGLLELKPDPTGGAPPPVVSSSAARR